MDDKLVPLLSSVTEGPNVPWDELDRQMFAHAARYSDYKLVQESTSGVDQCVRSYWLHNTLIQVSTDCTRYVEVCFISGKHTKKRSFADGLEVLRYTALLEKYMLVIEAITHLEGVSLARARDIVADTTEDGIRIDVILSPTNKINTPKFRLIALIPANDTLIATITFTEKYWMAPTPDPAVRHKRHAQHFKTVHTFVDFIQQERKRHSWV